MPEILETGVTLDDLQLLSVAQLTDKFVVRRGGLDRALPLSLILALFTNGAPVALDTWLEVVQRLEDDEDALAAINSALGNRLRFDAAQSLSAAQQAQAQVNLGVSNLVPEYVSGLTLSNNATDVNNDIDISTGSARGNGKGVTNGSTMTKRLDASWVAGSGNGGLDTGSKANGTTYHVHSIVNNTTLAFDAIFSTSASAPTVPGGWTLVQRLGSVLTDGSGNIRGFKQRGKNFIWATPVNDVNVGTQGTTAVSRTLTVPTGIEVLAMVHGVIFNTSAAAALISSLSSTDATPALNGIATVYTAIANAYGNFQVDILTNTSGQIRSRASAASTTLICNTVGYTDISLRHI